MQRLLVLISLFFVVQFYSGQYVTNGSTITESCNCYRLTDEVFFQSGTVWNVNQINLNNSFDYNFNVFLGCKDANGADGMCFILQPLNTSLGGAGSGGGYAGITPSIGVLLDTYQNTVNADPVFDYISIQKNGIVDHNLGQDLAPPVQASVNSPNIENCDWHNLRIQWDAATKKLSVYFDNEFRTSATVDIVSTIFSGNPNVYWGFSASTGGLNNIHRVCTALNPNFTSTAINNNQVCFGTPVQFQDASVSFGPIANWFWNFGDGTTFSGQTPPPKIFDSVKTYQVSLTITGSDGCTSTAYVQNIQVVTQPISSIFISDTVGCVNETLQFIDSSKQNNSGFVTSWLWNFGDNTTSNLQNPTKQYSAPGNYWVTLVAKNQTNCVTNIDSQLITIKPNPLASFVIDNTPKCEGNTINFIDNSNLNSVPLLTQTWNLGVGGSQTYNVSTNVSQLYNTAQNYNINLLVKDTNNCFDDTTIVLTINSKPNVLFSANERCVGSVTNFINASTNAAGSPLTSFSFLWNFDDAASGVNNSSTLINPTHSFTATGNYYVKLQATDPNGCIKLDSSLVKIFTKPNVDFSVNSNQIICSGSTLGITNNTTNNNGNISQIQIYPNANNNAQFQSFNNPTIGQTVNFNIPKFYNPTQLASQIKLVAIVEDNACKDSLIKDIIYHALPQIKKPDSLFTCNNQTAFVLPNPEILNNLTGTFTYTGQHVANNILNASAAQVGDKKLNLIFTSNVGCVDSVEQIVQIQEPLVLNSPSPILIGENSADILPVTVNGTYPLGANYLWKPNTYLNNDKILNPVCKPSNDIQYTLQSITKGGCITEKLIDVKVLKELIIPNTFTPNNDGINDTWIINYLSVYKDAKVQVFDRYGKPVFEGNNNTIFNGTYKNKALPLGTYYYIINLPTSKKTYKGFVTIVK